MKTNQSQINIPDGWHQVKLGNICNIYDGTHQTPTYLESGIPFYSVEHVTSNDFSKTKFISEDIYISEIRRVKIEQGDILMTRIGDVGTTKYIDWEPKASFYVSLALIKCKNDTSSKFIDFIINSDDFQKEIKARSLLVAFPNKINLGDIGKCLLNLPSLVEQNRIVSVLETWDKTIEKLAQKIEVKKQIKKGLMQDLLTGKKRLSGYKEEWKYINLGSECAINPKIQKLPNSFIYIDLESVENGHLLKENKIGIDKAPSRAQRLLKKGDILFQMVRPYQKNNLFFNKDGDYVASTGYAQIRTKNSNYYLYHLIHTDSFVNKVMDRCTGSSYPAINSSDLSEIEIKIPKDTSEQDAIAVILTTADKEITELQNKLSIIKDQKKYLLNNLITGTIRTPETLSANLT